MGISLRKSFKAGPFRLNLSKSGIGVSGGVKGLRVSTGPRGAQMTAGRGGVRYTKRLGGGQAPQPTRAFYRFSVWVVRAVLVFFVLCFVVAFLMAKSRGH